MKKTVHVLGGERAYVKMFRDNGWSVVPMKDAEFIQFTGGEDVSPELYEEENVASYNNKYRDNLEKLVFDQAKKNGQKMLGICRGGQFLTVMSGHRLWQDVDKHGVHGTHEATAFDGEKVDVSSTHHQMFRLKESGPPVEVLMTAKRATYKTDDAGKHTEDLGDDLESLFFPDSQAMAFQPHPEFFDPEHICQKTYFRFIDHCFNN